MISARPSTDRIVAFTSGASCTRPPPHYSLPVPCFASHTVSLDATFLPLRPSLSSLRPSPPLARTLHLAATCHAPPRASLNRRRLGSSPLTVTEACLGTMLWGSQSSAADAYAQLQYAIHERGLDFLDTAEMYPVPAAAPDERSGRTEALIGAFLARDPPLRRRLILATKVVGRDRRSRVVASRHPPHRYQGASLPDGKLDRRNIREACHASLRRLATDYIDLYQLHWPDRYVPKFGPRAYDRMSEWESVPFRETLAALKELMDEGKIRAYGLSNETTYGVAECVRAADELGMPRPATIQNQFCLLNRRFEADLAEACASSHYDIGLLPYSTLGGGVLSGKYLGKLNVEGKVTDPELRRSRFGLYDDYMVRYKKEKALVAVAKYQKIADEAGLSLATLAQAFCKSRQFVASSIIGATSLAQLKENIDAFEVELDPVVLEKIDEVHLENKDVAG